MESGRGLVASFGGLAVLARQAAERRGEFGIGNRARARRNRRARMGRERPASRLDFVKRPRLNPESNLRARTQQALGRRFDFGRPVTQARAPGRRVGENHQFVFVGIDADNVARLLRIERRENHIAKPGEPARLPDDRIRKTGERERGQPSVV